MEDGGVDRGTWRANLRVGPRSYGPFLLPLAETVRLGRAPECGLHADHASISWQLASLEPSEHGLILENGDRTRVTASSVFVLNATFAPRARVLLQPADWTLTWDLDTLTELTLQYRLGAPPVGMATARDRAARPSPDRPRTLIAGRHLRLTDLQRRRLGALFAYLINDEPKPDQLLETAARLSGDSVAQINRTWVRVRDYVNRDRDIPIQSIEDLGYHLVKVAGLVGPDDLPEASG